ncbi:MAG: YggS family pyridoxal phosphate-dependent enzyme [Bacteroidales bacterium]|jgi:pyridoxal phosphate enzyme (YggS family)|nr:YggS family pyridoxal phosphate-dependent enzyme [Bacteroidales bacterium]
MKQIAQNLENIRKTIPENVALVVVSKTYPATTVKEAYDAGQRVFGENKAQELFQKQSLLPNDIEWHFIGHLQSNKIKYIASIVKLIHSVDSFKLLKAINKEAEKVNRAIDCLLQFHIAEEESKFGLDLEEAATLLQSNEYLSLRNIRLVGVMGMATFTDDMEQVRKEFIHLRQIFERLKKKFFSGDDHFKEISMGMSDDYPIAIEEGGTIVRIGSAIFGKRNYL